MKVARIRPKVTLKAVALGAFFVWTFLLQGCAGPTTAITTPDAAASPISNERYEKVLKLLAEEPNEVIQTASKRILEGASPQELTGFACLRQDGVNSVVSRGKTSDTLRDFVKALVATLPRANATCPPLSGEWQLDFLTYSRWRTGRKTEPDPSRDAAAKVVGEIGGTFPYGTALVLSAAVFVVEVYAASCIGTAGLICPIPGETIFVALGTSTGPQDGEKATLLGVGVAQGEGKISAWSAVTPDPEPLGLAFAQALKGLASNYAAVMTKRATTSTAPAASVPPERKPRDARSRQPLSTEDVVNCMSGGDRRWVHESECD